jgi:hypothetical protein
VDLVRSGVNKVDFNANLNDIGSSVTGSVSNLDVSTDGSMANGYSAPDSLIWRFLAPGMENLNAYGNSEQNQHESSPSKFNFTESGGLLFAAVHIGSLLCTDQASGVCSPGVSGHSLCD